MEKTLESPLNSKRSNQSILKEISPEYSLEGWTLKLNLQYFGHLMRRTDSLEKTVILGKIEGRRSHAPVCRINNLCIKCIRNFLYYSGFLVTFQVQVSKSEKISQEKPIIAGISWENRNIWAREQRMPEHKISA